MNKKLIFLLLFCAAAMLVWVSSGFSWGVYSSGCGDCHGGAADVHPIHDAIDDCTACHVDGFGSPTTDTCVVCHPLGDPGECPLAIGHDDAPQSETSCLTCHVACDDPEPECETDADCDDGVFCNGIESCSTEGSVTVCVDGDEPCEEDKICIEGDPVECIECEEDADCEEGEVCVNDVCSSDECPEGTPEEVILFDEDGDCLLNKDEYKKYTDTLKTRQKAEKDTLKTKQKVEKDVQKQKHSLEKDKSKVIKTNFTN